MDAKPEPTTKGEQNTILPYCEGVARSVVPLRLRRGQRVRAARLVMTRQKVKLADQPSPTGIKEEKEMRQPVVCKNCGLKWLRVTVFGSELELTEDLQYLCPKCNSNWCESIPADSPTPDTSLNTEQLGLKPIR